MNRSSCNPARSARPNLREILTGPFRQVHVVRLAAEAAQDAERFDEVLRLTSDPEPRVSWRAIWVCGKISEKHPERFAPVADELIRRLTACRRDGSRRLWLAILHNVYAHSVPDDEFPADLLDYCLEHMLLPQESAGVQALAIRTAFVLCRREADLLGELRLLLEEADAAHCSAGVRCTLRNTLRKIRLLSLSLRPDKKISERSDDGTG